MIIQEDLAKQYLRKYGVLVPEGSAANTIDQVRDIAENLNNKVVVKAIVPTGGRGKAGGVKVCRSRQEVEDFAERMFGSTLLGHQVDTLLVEETVTIHKELYTAVHLDYLTGMTNILFSLNGGVDVESNSEHIHVLSFETGADLPVHRIKIFLKRIDIDGLDSDKLSLLLATICRLATDVDALLLEINPLAVLENGKLTALDCKLEIDDNALSRHADFLEKQRQELPEREARAAQLGVSYVPLEGRIGVIASGAGLGMATMDMLNQRGLTPANFLDTGGGISEFMLQHALQLVLEPDGVDGCIINLYGGINRMKEAANGIAKALGETGEKRDIVVKILGNQQEEAWDILSKIPNVHVIRVFQTETAVDKLEELLRK